MMEPAQGPHPGDDDLVLHYYGEADPATARAIEAHLAGCQSCRASFQRIDEVLALVASHADAEAPEGFGRVMWARVAPQVGAPGADGWRRWFQAPRLALAGGVAGLVLAAFVAGRWTGPAPAVPAAATAVATVAPERVWLAAVGDHLDRSQMVLAEAMNADPGAPFSAADRARAADLVAGSRLLRQSAASGAETPVAGVLEELERVLIEIANGGDDVAAADLEALRTRIESRGVLFRLRVVGAEVRARALRRAPVS